MSRVWSRREFIWDGDTLSPRGRKHPSISLVADGKYPGMWRLRLPDGALSDMVNRSRAKDAARSKLRAILSHQETPAGDSPMSFDGAAQPTLAVASEQRVQQEVV
jgi:hypothetical protein